MFLRAMRFDLPPWALYIRVPTRKIREFSIFSVNIGLRPTPSARRFNAANIKRKCLEIFRKKSPFRTLDKGLVKIYYMYIV